jgi:DNA-binding MarR family transcriptional regulator
MLPWALRRTNQRYMRSVRSVVDERGYRDLPQRGFWVLAALVEGDRTTGDLAVSMHVTKQATSQLVATLTELGYVEGRKHPTDARRVQLHLTARGRRAADAVETGCRRMDEELMAQLGESAFRRLSDLLRRAGDGSRAAGVRSVRR